MAGQCLFEFQFSHSYQKHLTLVSQFSPFLIISGQLCNLQSSFLIVCSAAGLIQAAVQCKKCQQLNMEHPSHLCLSMPATVNIDFLLNTSMNCSLLQIFSFMKKIFSTLYINFSVTDILLQFFLNVELVFIFMLSIVILAKILVSYLCVFFRLIYFFILICPCHFFYFIFSYFCTSS